MPAPPNRRYLPSGENSSYKQRLFNGSGEAGEAVGAVVSLVDGGLGDHRLAAQFQYLEGRVAAMLTGLIKRHRR